MSAPVVCLDTETFYDSKRKVSVKNYGAWAYAHHPEFYCFLLSVYDGSELWVGEPKDFNFAALDGAHLLSHNAFFDRTVAEAEVERGNWPKINFVQWDCTANMTACLCNRRSLKDAVMFLLGEDLSKTARNEMDGVHWADIRGTKQAEEFIAYTGVDAIKPWVIYDKFKACWSPFEQALSRMAVKQSMRGVNINVDKLDSYLESAKRLLFDIESKLPWIAETAGDKKPAKPTSTKAIAMKCREAGIPTPPVKAHEGEEAYLIWEKTYAPQYAWIQAVTSWRSLNKFIGTLETIKERIRPDGTLSFGQKYFGAHCLTGDAEVLTSVGWEKLATWGGGDIAQWSPDGRVEFLPATANRFEVDEVLARPYAPYLGGTFTLGHTFPCFTQVKHAFKTEKTSEVMARFSAKHPVSGVLSSLGSITPDSMRVLVAVQADGHFTDDGILQFCLRKKRKIDRIKQLLGSAGIPFTCGEFASTPGQIRVAVARKDLPAWLCPDRKVFGSWLLDSTPEARTAFVREILLWDGYEPQNCYYSTTKQNADWAATICHLSGVSMHVSVKKDRRPTKSGVRQPLFVGVIRNRGYAMTNKAKWRTHRHRGSVYCPTTQTGFWVYRADGKIGVTGNTGRNSGDAGVNLYNLRKDPIFVDDNRTIRQDELAAVEFWKAYDLILEAQKVSLK